MELTKREQEIIRQALDKEISFLEDNSYRYKLSYGDQHPEYIKQSGMAKEIRALRDKVGEP